MTTATMSRGPVVNQFALVRGVKFTLKATPGVWQVLRESERSLNGREMFRARELSGSVLIGPVKHVHPTDVADIIAEGLDADGRKVKPEPKAEPKTKANRCGLTLSINGVRYRVRPIEPGFAGVKAFRLSKADGQVYDVVQTLDGSIECDCADYTYRRQGLTGEPCKHGRACHALGLIG